MIRRVQIIHQQAGYCPEFADVVPAAFSDGDTYFCLTIRLTHTRPRPSSSTNAKSAKTRRRNLVRF